MAQGGEGEFDENQAGLHVEDARAVGLALLDAKGVSCQAAHRPYGVHVAEDQGGLGLFSGCGVCAGGEACADVVAALLDGDDLDAAAQLG